METRGAWNTHVAVVDRGRDPAGSRVSARHRIRPVLVVALGLFQEHQFRNYSFSSSKDSVSV